MNCPKCGEECYDNTEDNEKRKSEGRPLRPDFSCKDKEGCGWLMWPEKGARKIVVKTGPLTPKPEIPTENNIRERTMVMSYAKDCVVKKIEVGLAEPGDTATQIIAIFRELWSELVNPLGKV